MEELDLGAKEGLAFINGTQLTTALAIKIWCETDILLKTANMITAMSIEGMRGAHDMLSEELLYEDRQDGSSACGREIRSWLGETTEIKESHHDCGKVQDPYSLRCAPQVHGVVWEELEHSKSVLKHAVNSTTDNPILFPNEGKVLHGGNFHAIYSAKVCDRFASALATMANISERRMATAMKNDKSGLPTFLIEEGGLNSGFMMVQATAAALASECKSLSFPASVDSIPTNNDQEDHVSMGPIAGLKTLKIVENARYVLAIELFAAAQAIDLLRPLKTSDKLEKVHKKLRNKVMFLDKDRFLNNDLETIYTILKSGELIL